MTPRLRTLSVLLAMSVTILLVSFTAADTTAPFEATIDRCRDGDTCTLTTTNGTRLKLRLAGIDAPEVSHGRIPGQPFDHEASAYLNRLIRARDVTVQVLGIDRYRRLLVLLWLDDTSINLVF